MELKLRLVQMYLDGDASLNGLAREHDISRHLIRVWVDKFHKGELSEKIAFVDRLLDPGGVRTRTRPAGGLNRRPRLSTQWGSLQIDGHTLDNFDFTFQPGIEKGRIETLATCAFIRDHATVLACGPPGTGKTHLAIALGVKAVENGFSVAFYRLEDLLYAMKQDSDVAPRSLRGKKYLKVWLLIINEVGFQLMTP